MKLSGYACIAVLIAGLTGCAGGNAGPSPQASATPPADYRSIVADYFKTTLKDAQSVRDARISNIRPAGSLTGYDWEVCVKVNAKNSFGGYTGSQVYWIPFDGRTIGTVPQQGHTLYCDGSTRYSRFNELMPG